MTKRRSDVQLEQVDTETVVLAARLTPLEGINRSLLEDVTLLRRSKSIPRSPVLHEPKIIFVVQGRKTAYVGSQRVVYEPRTVLVLFAPIPFECVTEAPDNKPLLSVSVRLRKEMVVDILANMPERGDTLSPHPKAIKAIPFDEEVSDVLIRLLRILISPDDARVLGDQCLRELIYRVLKGKGGSGVRAMVDVGGHFSQIYSVLQRIHDEYSRTLEVSDLARQAGMSVSTFHLHFKQVASTSPNQYIKAVRMHRARALMLESGTPAGIAATKVGYKSASQFGREFKRFFGSSPAQEIESE